MGLLKNVINAKISGNVGSMNFRKRGSEIVVAERSYSNKSKGTGASEKQREHRSRLANVVNFFKVIKAIEARAWQYKEQNVSDFNMLSKYNLANSPIFLTKQEATLNASVIAPYIVAMGDLSSCGAKFDAGVCKPGVKVGTDFDFSNNNIGGLSAAIIANNEGWKQGDKLSIAVLSHGYKTSAGKQIPQASVSYFEITIDSENTNPISGVGDLISHPMSKDAEGDMVIGGSMQAIFAVHSRIENSQLLTSTETIAMASAADAVLTKYSSATQKAAAMASYGYQGTVLLTPGAVSQTVVAADPAVITSAKAGTAVLVDGGSYTGVTAIEVEGTDLTSANCKLVKDGVVFVAQTATKTKRTWSAGSNGQYQLYVNGVVAYTFTVSGITVTATEATLGLNTYSTLPQSNVTVNKGQAYEVSVKGAGLSSLTATGGTMASVQTTADGIKGTFTAPADESSPWTISADGIVVISGSTITPDEEEPPMLQG